MQTRIREPSASTRFFVAKQRLGGARALHVWFSTARAIPLASSPSGPPLWEKNLFFPFESPFCLKSRKCYERIFLSAPSHFLNLFFIKIFFPFSCKLSKLLEMASEAVDTMRGQTVVVGGVVETQINKFLPFLKQVKQSKKLLTRDIPDSK